jgi:hypothetical protein
MSITSTVYAITTRLSAASSKQKSANACSCPLPTGTIGRSACIGAHIHDKTA